MSDLVITTRRNILKAAPAALAAVTVTGTALALEPADPVAALLQEHYQIEAALNAVSYEGEDALLDRLNEIEDRLASARAITRDGALGCLDLAKRDYNAAFGPVAGDEPESQYRLMMGLIDSAIGVLRTI